MGLFVVDRNLIGRRRRFIDGPFPAELFVIISVITRRVSVAYDEVIP